MLPKRWSRNPISEYHNQHTNIPPPAAHSHSHTTRHLIVYFSLFFLPPCGTGRKTPEVVDVGKLPDWPRRNCGHPFAPDCLDDVVNMYQSRVYLQVTHHTLPTLFFLWLVGSSRTTLMFLITMTANRYALCSRQGIQCYIVSDVQ